MKMREIRKILISVVGSSGFTVILPVTNCGLDWSSGGTYSCRLESRQGPWWLARAVLSDWLTYLDLPTLPYLAS